MQRSPCNRKLAAWIAKTIGYYVDETMLKDSTDFKRISWTVNRVLLNWMQWKPEFCLLSTMSMRSQYERTPTHSSEPFKPPVSARTYSFMSGQCCTRNCDRESLCCPRWIEVSRAGFPRHQMVPGHDHNAVLCTVPPLLTVVGWKSNFSLRNNVLWRSQPQWEYLYTM